MQHHTITSKGQVTIPKHVRQQLGIRQGSEVEFAVVGDHIELRVVQQPAEITATGFGLLKSAAWCCSSVPRGRARALRWPP